MYKLVKKDTTKDDKLPKQVITPYYHIEAVPNSDGTYSGWIYLDEQLVEEIRHKDKLVVLKKCNEWVENNYHIVPW